MTLAAAFGEHEFLATEVCAAHLHGGRSPRRVGKRLRKCAHRPLAGLEGAADWCDAERDPVEIFIVPPGSLAARVATLTRAHSHAMRCPAPTRAYCPAWTLCNNTPTKPARSRRRAI